MKNKSNQINDKIIFNYRVIKNTSVREKST